MNNFIDLTGEKIGKLTVLEYVGDAKWLCKCECGNTKVIDGKHLRSGETKSCGCLIEEKANKIIGQRFGKLTVIERAEDYISPKGYKKSQWKCVCDCGSTIIVAINCLKNGHTKSCGCISKDKVNEIIGQKFGRLTVIERAENGKNGEPRWLCKCDCGNETIARGSFLKNGRVKSCGCIAREKIVITNDKEKRLHRIWSAIKTRCYNKNAKSYKNYGGRGIKICDEWLDNFTNFSKWSLQNGYKDYLSIDRIDVNGNYEPSNCKWSTDKEQANNKRNTLYITYNNKTQSLRQWCDELNLKYKTIANRIKRYNWTPERAFTTPIQDPVKRIEYRGKIKPLKQWCEELNMSYPKIANRIRRGWTVEDSFEK